MQRFDVHVNPDARSRTAFPYLVIVQSEHTLTGATVIVAAIARKSAPIAAAKLQVPVTIKGESLVTLFHTLTAVDRAILGPPVARLPELRDQMMTAIDLLFLGF